jgi:hypothetical protein
MTDLSRRIVADQTHRRTIDAMSLGRRVQPFAIDRVGMTRPDAKATAARVVREAILSFAGEPGIGAAMARIAKSATDEQLLKIARRIK